MNWQTLRHWRDDLHDLFNTKDNALLLATTSYLRRPCRDRIRTDVCSDVSPGKDTRNVGG